MQSAHCLLLRCALLLAPLAACAQEIPATPTTIAPAIRTIAPAIRESASAQIPEAPIPNLEVVTPVETGGGQGEQTPAPSSSSSQQTPTLNPDTPKSDREKAHEQIKEQEQQRLLGVVPMFNTTYRSDAVSLTAKEKMALAFRSSIDPVTFATAFVVAGYREALDDDSGFGWGAEGYFKRSGAAYLDAFNGTMIGNGILPSILHQDPRYFRLGHGSTTHRLLYAASTTVICKHDNTGKWEPNYSNVAGNIISGAISNLYYPSGESGIGQTFTNGMIVTAEGTIGGIFQEFWPDISRKIFHRDPTHGLDTQTE